MRLSRAGLLTVLAFSLYGCYPCVEAEPTGCPIVLDNVYANPEYCHDEVVNVLLLPFDNPFCVDHIEFHRDELTLALLRSLGKFHYFNLQYDHHFDELAGEVVNLGTGYLDRLKLGAIGQEYNVQAVLKVSIDDYRPFPPMQMRVKAALLAVETGEQIWGFDHVFDFDDANVVNDMRVWWNSNISGGDTLRNRFDIAMVRPTMMHNYVFFRVARSYAEARVANSLEAEREAMEQALLEEEWLEVQDGVNSWRDQNDCK